MTGLVEYEVDGSVGRLRLNRPEKRNAFSRAMVADGIAAVDFLVAAGVTVATIEAAGSVFSAGDDVSPEERDRGGVNTVEQFVERVHSAAVFWIAVADGPVVGAAVALAARCPVVLATERAWFRLPERDLGVYPGFVVEQIAPVVGPRRALELAVGARRIPATEAVAIGLATELAEDPVEDAVARWVGPLRDAPAFTAQAWSDWRRAVPGPAGEVLR